MPALIVEQTDVSLVTGKLRHTVSRRRDDNSSASMLCLVSELSMYSECQCKLESLAVAKANPRQQCVYEGP